MQTRNLILLNGFAGSGKSTIARRYIDEHPLSLLIEGDELIVNMGQWLEHEPQARDLVYAHLQHIAATHLTAGYDVVLPYLVTDASHVKAFEQIAATHHANFFNFLLFNEKEQAIARLLERGTWGEAGLDPLSDKDMPEISRLYDAMEQQLESQKGIIIVNQAKFSVDESYEYIEQCLATS